MPSLSPTPPSSTTRLSQNAANGAKDKDQAMLREGGGTNRKDACLENMRRSSPDSSLNMPDVAAAIEGAARSSSDQAALLEPRNPAIGKGSNRRFSNIIPHNIREEESPQDRFHDPVFQQAFGNAKRLMSDLADVLGSSSLDTDPDSTMQRLHREARDLAQFQCPSSRIVGFVGDSGVGTLPTLPRKLTWLSGSQLCLGKSSLLNSLLDFRGLARTVSESRGQ